MMENSAEDARGHVGEKIKQGMEDTSLFGFDKIFFSYMCGEYLENYNILLNGNKRI